MLNKSLEIVSLEIAIDFDNFYKMKLSDVNLHRVLRMDFVLFQTQIDSIYNKIELVEKQIELLHPKHDN